jgi:hypothetical protein
MILTGLMWNSAENLMSEIGGEGRPTHIIMWQGESQQPLHLRIK